MNAQTLVPVYTEPVTDRQRIERHLKDDPNREDLLKVIECESSFNLNAHNASDPNTGSYGLAQFQLGTYAHFAPKIGLEGIIDANNIAGNWQDQLKVMQYMFSEGLQHHWTCSKLTGIIN